MLVTLVLLAVASLAGAAVLSWFEVVVPAAAIHLALAVGVMPLITGAMTHFVPVLSRSSAPPAGILLLPALLAFAGALVVYSLAGASQAHHAAASLALVASFVFAAWTVRRAGKSVGKPHPCLHWYLAAMVCLALALAAVVAMTIWPAQYQALKRLHLHLNTLGFVGLTAVATLQVLLPTAVGRPDVQAAARLRRHLPWALGGTVLTAVGAAWFEPLAYLGIALWMVPLVQLGRAWITLYSVEIGRPDGAASSLAVATGGFLILLWSGLLHARGILEPGQATLGFVLAFLLPLVTGAASQLLPIWIRPGRQGPWHEAARRRLGAGGAWRAILFLLGGLLVSAGWRSGLLFALAALIMFVLQLAVTIGTHLTDRGAQQ